MRWWQISKRDADLERELRSDLELEEDEQRDRGLSPEESRHAARCALGNTTLIREQTHETWGWAPFQRLLQDLRYALRQLRRSPGFALVCLLTLSLGIGANTAMFSVVQGVILAPLPFPQADHLVFLWENRPGVHQLDVSYPNFEDWRRTSQSFESMSLLTIHNFDLTAPGKAEHLVGIRASSGLLTTLGVKPAIGRDIEASEDQANSPFTVLISDRLWRERFASDPGVPGRPLVLDGKSFTVIGVLPAGFHFLADADVITPLRPNMPVIYADRSVDALAVLARLKPGITIAAADAEMNAIQQELDRQYPDANRSVGVAATSMMQQIIGDVKGTILLLYGAVSLVLLITCANVANLLLARSTSRAREFGIRAALGASRGRMVRQLLTESVVLSLAGEALGAVLAGFGVRLLLAALPNPLPRSENIGLHLPVLLFTALASMAIGILFGLVPAVQCASPEVQGALQKTSRGTTTGKHRMLSSLIIVQFAFTLVLMAGAGLLLRSIRNLSHVNPGFDVRHVISFQVGLSPSLTNTPDETRAAYRQLLARIRELPGVEAADLSNIVPLSGADNGGPFWIGTKQPASLQEAPHALYFWTGPDYLKTMGIPLLQGGFFTPADQIGSSKVVVIDSVLAHTFFPGQNPVGQTLTVGHWGAARIVGVVGHVRHWGLDEMTTGPPAGLRATHTVCVLLELKSKMTKAEAREALRLEVARQTGQNLGGGKVLKDSSTTFEWFVRNRYFPLRKGDSRPETAKEKMAQIEIDLIARFGEYPLDAFDRFMLQTHVNDLAQRYSQDRVKHARSYLKSIFDEAIEQEFLIKDPTRKLKIPKNLRPKDKRVLSWDQMWSILAETARRDRLLLMLDMTEALRPSELFALKWRSFDDQNTLSITEAVYRRAIRPFGKTPGSLSKVHLPDGLASELRRWKLECKNRSPEVFIFPNADGGFIDTANYRFRVLKPLTEKLGIEKLNFQILRRTMATQAQRMGSVKDIQAHLRHARPDATAYEYMQELPEGVQQMVSSVYAMLQKGGDPAKGVVRLLPNATNAPRNQAVSH